MRENEDDSKMCGCEREERTKMAAGERKGVTVFYEEE